ncbi:MAG: hypothetical protein M1115_08695 [Actinobacteria bacterium]|nr:hypothetical protein [Actinomycetota bacterium]
MHSLRRLSSKPHPILRHWRQVILSPLELAATITAASFGLPDYEAYLRQIHMDGATIDLITAISVVILSAAAWVSISGVRRALFVTCGKPAWTKSNCPDGYVLYEIQEGDKSFWEMATNLSGVTPLDLAKPNLDHRMRKAVFAPVLRLASMHLKPGWVIVIPGSLDPSSKRR